MSLRKKIIIDYVKKGMMPAFASASQLMQMGTASIAVNLTGTRESVYNILGESSSEVLQKVLKTAAEVTNGQGHSYWRGRRLALRWFQMTAGQGLPHSILRSMARSLFCNRRIQPAIPRG